jgi:hypothetical protein
VLRPENSRFLSSEQWHRCIRFEGFQYALQSAPRDVKAACRFMPAR